MLWLSVLCSKNKAILVKVFPWTSREYSLELIELSGAYKVRLNRFPPVVTLDPVVAKNSLKLMKLYTDAKKFYPFYYSIFQCSLN